jgi:archaellum component FlaF (FlaF/FlaG flagellin family)
MGFSDVAIQVIMFISVLIVGAMVVVFFNNYSKETVDNANIQRQQLTDKMKTSITIDVTNYVNSTNPDTLYIYVKNTGRTILNQNNLDIYIDKDRIPNNSSQRNTTILSDTDKINLGKWDPKEEIMIKIFKNVPVNRTHTVDIILDNGIKDSAEFSN